MELGRRGVDDVDFFWALLDDDVVWDMSATTRLIDLPEVIVGRDAVIEASRRYWGTWDEYRLAAEEVIDAGEQIVLVVDERGRGKGSGVPFQRRFAQVWTFEGGKVVRWEVFSGKVAALQAVGLTPEAP